MSRCVRLSFFLFLRLTYLLLLPFEEKEAIMSVNDAIYSSVGLHTILLFFFFSFFLVSYMRMVKWKLVTIAFLILIISTYLTSELKQKFNYLTVHQRTNLHTLLVFIHIQKTAGSEFERAIVRRLSFQSQSSCQCPILTRNNRTKRLNVKLRCNCTRDNQPWLISRFSVGWLCGVHADWMNYHRCLPAKINSEYGFQQRKFLYATLLREPISRFLSEYLHTLRGATWLSERLSCHKARQLRNQSACWKRTNLTDFIFCPFNPAVNRQTRMLSSPTTNCLSPSFTYSNLIDLQTAKINLQSMEFFGLTEYLHLSQRLFERTSYCQVFPQCSFQSYLEQDLTNNQTNDYLEENLTSIDFHHLRKMNSDDIELYQFARKLFFQRTCRILGIACH